MLELSEAKEIARRTNTWLANSSVSRTLLDRCSLRHLKAGEALHFAGDDSRGMYGIVEGSMKVFVSGVDHGPYYAHIMTVGTWGGEGPAIVSGTRPVTLVAATTAAILFIQRPAMIELALEHPEFWEFYTGQTMFHLTVAVGAVADLMIRDQALRLVSVLLRFGNCRSSIAGNGGSESAIPITIHASQSELATAANIARTTANRELLKLQTAGLVDVNYGYVVLLDPAGLRRMLAESDL